MKIVHNYRGILAATAAILIGSASIGFAVTTQSQAATVCDQTRKFYSDASKTTQIGEYAWYPEGECDCALIYSWGNISLHRDIIPGTFCEA